MFVAARLEVGAVAARADLEPFVAARGPQLDVVLLGGDEAEIAGADGDHAVRDAEAARNVVGVADDLLQRRGGVARRHELVHLDLVELVAALDAAHVAPGRHLLAPEAGGVGDVRERQDAVVEDLVAVQVGDRDLRRGDHPEIVLGVVVDVVGELRQLPGAVDALLLDQVRRVDLGVAVLARVQIEHPGDQRALQAGPLALEDVEARAGDLDAAIEVDNVEIDTDLPMRPRREPEAARLAFAAQYRVGAVVGADRDGRIREVGHLEHEALELRLGASEVLFESADAVADGAHVGHQLLARRGVLLADRARHFAAVRAQRLDLLDHAPPPRVGGQHGIDPGRRESDLVELGLHKVGALTDQADVQHALALACTQSALKGAYRPRPSQRTASTSRSTTSTVNTSVITQSQSVGRLASTNAAAPWGGLAAPDWGRDGEAARAEGYRASSDRRMHRPGE